MDYLIGQHGERHRESTRSTPLKKTVAQDICGLKAGRGGLRCALAFSRALIVRIVHDAEIISIEGESYRRRDAEEDKTSRSKRFAAKRPRTK